MTMGAVFVESSRFREFEKELTEIQTAIGKKTLHSSDLKHFQLIYFCRAIREMKLRLFGVISRKDTLGSYKSDINSKPTAYYNKCAQYLLERFGQFLEIHGIPKTEVDVVFEDAKFADYSGLRSLIKMCQKNPMRKNTEYLRNINAECIRSEEKGNSAMMQVADLVAHALYKSVDRNQRQYDITEPRYLKELSPRFFGCPETQEVLQNGIYCVHSIQDICLQSDVKQVFESLRADPAS